MLSSKPTVTKPIKSCVRCAANSMTITAKAMSPRTVLRSGILIPHIAPRSIATVGCKGMGLRSLPPFSYLSPINSKNMTLIENEKTISEYEERIMRDAYNRTTRKLFLMDMNDQILQHKKILRKIKAANQVDRTIRLAETFHSESGIPGPDNIWTPEPLVVDHVPLLDPIDMTPTPAVQRIIDLMGVNASVSVHKESAVVGTVQESVKHMIRRELREHNRSESLHHVMKAYADMIGAPGTIKVEKLVGLIDEDRVVFMDWFDAKYPAQSPRGKMKGGKS